MSDPAARWRLALLAATVLAVDPVGLGGLRLRARAGPVRDRWMGWFLDHCDRSVRRLPTGTADERLMGGLDLAATLEQGKAVASAGLLSEADGGVLLVPMAERVSPGTAARLGAVLDRGVVPDGSGRAARLGLLLLDEGAEPDEEAPAALCDRVALSVDLDAIPMAATDLPAADIVAIRQRLSADTAPGLEPLTAAAHALGIGSLRAPLQAARVARVVAAIAGHAPGEEDFALAAQLVLAPRATTFPAPEEEDSAEPPPPQDPQDAPDRGDSEQPDGPLEDRVLEAVRAILPDLALAERARARTRSSGTGQGARQKAMTHGRPAGTRAGMPEGGAPLDLLATLRTAAPWQGLRGRRPGGRLHVLPDDFRLRRFERPAESVTIFLVDASGSAAAARMAEAKGAVELMLAESYRRREQVALIAFRGTGAELLLPPTRALVQARRRLAVLPGGGGTPLAAALMAGAALARQVRQRGATPYLVALTDGRANIALDGTPGRAAAAEDTQAAARNIAAMGLVSVVLDTSSRPSREAEALARDMAARYLPLPRADAGRISGVVRAALA